MPPDSNHNEIEIMLDNKLHILRPSLEAVGNFEGELAAGTAALAKKLLEGTITLEELASVITHCMEAEKDKIAVKEAILRSGLTKAIHSVAGVFTLLLGGVAHAAECAEAMTLKELQEMRRLFPDH